MSYPPLQALHLTLLARAAIRFDGAILPIEDPAADLTAANEAAADDLVHQCFAEWIRVAHEAVAWRRLGHALIGLVITDRGRSVLDALEMQVAYHAQSVSTLGRVVDLLTARTGASLIEIIVASGWRPHGARAVLTALRNKGFAIRKEPASGRRQPRYRLALEAGR